MATPRATSPFTPPPRKRGRPPTPPATTMLEAGADPRSAPVPADPEEFLLAVMQGKIAANPAQMAAVKALIALRKPYKPPGKKEGRAQAAAQASTGRFAPQQPPARTAPQLAVINSDR